MREPCAEFAKPATDEVRAVREAVKDVLLRWSVTVKAANGGMWVALQNRAQAGCCSAICGDLEMPGGTQPNVHTRRTAR